MAHMFGARLGSIRIDRAGDSERLATLHRLPPRRTYAFGFQN